MKILHSADWHLGKKLLRRDRSDERDNFFEQLKKIVKEKEVNLLLLTGDVFDVPRPPQEEERAFFELVGALNQLGCRTVVTAGNHDGALMIETGALLRPSYRAFAFVSGQVADFDPERYLLPLPDEKQPQCVLLALPFFRAGLWNENAAAGLTELYHKTVQVARERYPSLPLLAAGHFAACPSAVEDGSLDLSVGGLGMVSLESMPQVDLWALGHLHALTSTLSDLGYAGSPLAFSFDDRAPKTMRLITLQDGSFSVELVPLKGFRTLHQVSGSVEAVKEALAAAAGDLMPQWWKVQLDQWGVLSDLRKTLGESCAPHQELISLSLPAFDYGLEGQGQERGPIEDYGPQWFFQRLLEQNAEKKGLTEQDCKALKNRFEQLVGAYQIEDGE